MKFVLFLVCAIAAVQAYPSADMSEYPQYPQFQPYGIIDSIKALIEKVAKIINNVVSQIPNVVNSIKDKIKEVGAKVSESIKNIKQKVQELINLGAAGKKCVEQHRDELEALVKLAQNGAEACVSEANSQTATLKEQLKVLVKKANALRQDATNRLVKCVEESKFNPIALARCLSAQIEPLKTEVVALEKEVSSTIKVAKETAKNVVSSLANCSDKLGEDVANKEKEVLDSIKKCIKESN